MSFRFGGRWWIRTTEVIDDRFTVCSLWPLGKPSIFSYQLDWSWWTDLNPRPADYKSAALPTELRQHASDGIYYTHLTYFCQGLFSLTWRFVLITVTDYSIGIRTLQVFFFKLFIRSKLLIYKAPQPSVDSSDLEANGVSCVTSLFRTFLAPFRNFGLGMRTICPHPQHFTRISLPSCMTSHSWLPQGCFFFIWTMSPMRN